MVENQHSHQEHSPLVNFTSVQKTHCLSQDLLVQFKYLGTDGNNNDIFGDRVGLYKLPRTEPHQHVAYVWVDTLDGFVTLNKSVLPMEEGEYELQYIQGDFTVLGTSQKFSMVKHFVAPEEEVGFEEKVNDVELGHLAEELKKVTVDEIEDDEYWKSLCEELQQQNTCLKISEKVLSNLLENTIEKNIKLVEERSGVLGRCPNETIKNRDTAEKKLRIVIEQEDLLRLEMEQLKEENDEVKTEYKVVKQEFEVLNTKIRKEDSSRTEERMNDILVSLEVHKRFLNESENYVKDLEEDKKDLEEDKRDLVDANAILSVALEEYKLMHHCMKESVAMLENDKLELEQQLIIVSRESHSRASKESASIACLEEEIQIVQGECAEMRIKLAYYEKLMGKSDSEFVVIDPTRDEHRMSEVDVLSGNEVLTATNVGEASSPPSAPLPASSSTSVPLLSSTVPLPISTSSNVSEETQTYTDNQESIFSLTATASPPKPLYMGDCISDLQKSAKLGDTSKWSAKALCQASEKVFKEAVIQKDLGDEEKAYVYFFKYIDLIQKINENQEFKKDQKYFNSKFNIYMNSKEAIETLEGLAKSLIKRYESKNSRAFKEKSESEFVVIDPNRDEHRMSEVDVFSGNDVLEQFIASNVGEASRPPPLPVSPSTVPLPTSTSFNVSLETQTSTDEQESLSSLTATASPPPSLECPLCGETYLQDQVRDLENHVEGHDIENMLNCPVCNKLFDKLAGVDYQIHVETHFQLEVLEDYQRDQLSLAERGWDLGFDY